MGNKGGIPFYKKNRMEGLTFTSQILHSVSSRRILHTK
ncbi:hypothetical protein BOVA604_2280 [Bacteroides ovatus]|nr:hypothetical protein BOVA604_2280 [Bacteroides ovatus]